MRFFLLLTILFAGLDVMAQGLPQSKIKQLTNFIRAMGCVQSQYLLENKQWHAKPWAFAINNTHGLSMQYGNIKDNNARCGSIEKVDLKDIGPFNEIIQKFSTVIAMIGQDVPLRGLSVQPLLEAQQLFYQINFDFIVHGPVLSKQTDPLIIEQDNQIKAYVIYALSSFESSAEEETFSMQEEGNDFNEIEDELVESQLAIYSDEETATNEFDDLQDDNFTEQMIENESVGVSDNESDNDNNKVKGPESARLPPTEKITFPQPIQKLGGKQGQSGHASKVSADSLHEELNQRQQENYTDALRKY